MLFIKIFNNWYGLSIGVSSTRIKSRIFAWFTSWWSNIWNYLYTKKFITYFEWRIVGWFHCNIWISKYLQLPIHIWNKNNCWIILKVGNENTNHVLNILYVNNHFELVITCDPIINSSNIHTCDVYDTKF